jgi:hypothetical protein
MLTFKGLLFKLCGKDIYLQLQMDVVLYNEIVGLSDVGSGDELAMEGSSRARHRPRFG